VTTTTTARPLSNTPAVFPTGNISEPAPELFGELPVSLRVRLDRSSDRQKSCHDNIAIIHPGKAMHAAELRCDVCDKHRGWLRQEAHTFLKQMAARYGAPAQPIILRDHSIGENEMTKNEFDNTNRGALFRNTEKDGDNDRDYSGTINVNGQEFWISGWVKVSKTGKKFLSVAIRPKTPAVDTNKPLTEDIGDAVPF
jgi:hypothetical protein